MLNKPRPPKQTDEEVIFAYIYIWTSYFACCFLGCGLLRGTPRLASSGGACGFLEVSEGQRILYIRLLSSTRHTLSSLYCASLSLPSPLW
jgi:hypothetical protein